MKRSNYIIALVLSAAFIATSCSKHEMNDINSPDIQTKTVTFNTEVKVKSAVDTDGKIHFTTTEKFTPYVWSDGTTTNLARQFNILRGENGAVSVTHNLTDAQAYNYGFVSPASNANGFDGTNYTITLPTRQQPAADGSTFDPKADILISELVNLNAEDNGEAVAKFKRMFTFLKVTIPGDDNEFKPTYSTERLVSFEVKALDGTPLSGTATIPATTNYEDCVATFVNPSNSVEATYNSDIDFLEDRFVWLVVNPAKFKGLELVLHTQSRTYTRTFENFECEFQAETINKLTFKHNQNNNDPLKAENSSIINGVRYIQTKAVTVSETATGNYGLGGLSNESNLNVLMLTKKSESYNFELSNQGLTKDVVYIGVSNTVSPSEKVCLKISQRNQLRNPDGLIAFKNLKLDLTGLPASTDAFRLITNGNDIGGIREIIIEDCDIYMTQPGFLSIYGSPADSGIESIVVRNCRIFYTPIANNGAFSSPVIIDLNNSNPVLTQSGAEKYKSIIFDNNVIHWTNSTDLTTLNGFSLVYSTREDSAFTNLDIEITNNTFVEAIGNSTRGIVTFANMTDKSVRSVLVDRNVFYSSRTSGWPVILAIKYNYDNNWYRYMLDKNTNFAEGYQGIKLYYEPSNNTWAYPQEEGVKGAILAKKATLLPNLETGSYKIGTNYTGYGSSLE